MNAKNKKTIKFSYIVFIGLLLIVLILNCNQSCFSTAGKITFIKDDESTTPVEENNEIESEVKVEDNVQEQPEVM